METLRQDFRYAIRMMRKSPGFTLVAAFTIALGIGANTTIFSAMNATVFQPFSFPTTDRLVMVWERNDEAGIIRGSVAPANFKDWREQNQTLEQTVGIVQNYFDLSQGGQPERYPGYRVSASFFDVLGAKPLLGRTFFAEEDRPGDNHVVVLNYAIWQRRFGADPEIVNRTVMINGLSYTVIGVMPEDFNFPFNGGEMWSPAALDHNELANRQSHYMQVMGLLREGTSIEQAAGDLNAIALRAQEQFPDSNSGRSVRVLPITEDAARGARMYAPVMLGTVGFVLLIACANVANLLLARAALRRKEIAIRLAVGASRWRLMRQLLTESVLLALVGGALGLLLSVWGVKALSKGIPESFSKFIPGWTHLEIDRTAFLFTLVASVVTGLIFGLVPAIQATREKFNEVLKEGSKGAGGRHRTRTRGLLVVSEIALSVILLVCSGLMIKSFVELLKTDLGVNPEGVLTVQVSLPREKYDSEEVRINTYEQLLGRIAALPGVVEVGAAGTLPMAGTNYSISLHSVGQRVFDKSKQPVVNYRPVTAGYFKAIGTGLITGRDFTAQDRKGATPVALVDEAFAKRFLPGEEPVGKQLRSAAGAIEIVGTVANVMNDDFDNRTEPNIYTPYAQEAWRGMFLVVRSSSDPAQLASAVRGEVGAIDETLPMFNVNLMQDIINDRISPKRLATIMLGIFALLALALAAVGIYAVISYSVTQRTHEIGIRMALGARPRDVLRMVTAQGLKLALAGVAIGLAGALALTRVMAGLLFQVSATDPVTFVAIPAALLVVALAACAVPARRATRVDPMVALREG